MSLRFDDSTRDHLLSRHRTHDSKRASNLTNHNSGESGHLRNRDSKRVSDLTEHGPERASELTEHGFERASVSTNTTPSERASKCAKTTYDSTDTLCLTAPSAHFTSQPKRARKAGTTVKFREKRVLDAPIPLRMLGAALLTTCGKEHIKRARVTSKEQVMQGFDGEYVQEMPRRPNNSRKEQITQQKCFGRHPHQHEHSKQFRESDLCTSYGPIVRFDLSRQLSIAPSVRCTLSK